MKLPLTVVACIPLASTFGFYGCPEDTPKEGTSATGALENLARLRQ